VTQHGSFPDRPRGRRARHGSDPQWQSSSESGDPRDPDAIPQGEREFPDLEPIRGRRPRESDGRGVPGAPGGGVPGRGIGRRGRHSGPVEDSGPGVDGFSPPPSGQDQRQHGQYGQQRDQWPDQQSGGPQRFGGQQPGGQYGGRQPGGQPLGQGQQFADPQYGGQQFGGQQGYEQPAQFGGRSYPGQPGAGQPGAGQPDGRGQRRDERTATRAAGRGGRARSQVAVDPDDEITDDPMEAFSQRWARRGADEEEGRRPRRLPWIIGGGGVIVVAIAVAVYFLFGGNSGSSTVGFGSLVTTFLPGEIQTVPDACNVVSTATISQYMPGGQPDIAAPPLNGGQDSQCTWTLDSPPNYRVIEADISAFSPSGLASGDGSATFAAIDAYASDLQTLKSPSASSGQPKATITDINGLGTAAFSATQVFNVNGTTTYKATVIVRYHNVIVTTVVNGTEHAVTSKGTYGPVSMSTLATAANEVATQATAHLTS
jgi:hypothetical protein